MLTKKFFRALILYLGVSSGLSAQPCNSLYFHDHSLDTYHDYGDYSSGAILNYRFNLKVNFTGTVLPNQHIYYTIFKNGVVRAKGQVKEDGVLKWSDNFLNNAFEQCSWSGADHQHQVECKRSGFPKYKDADGVISHDGKDGNAKYRVLIQGIGMNGYQISFYNDFELYYSALNLTGIGNGYVDWSYLGNKGTTYSPFYGFRGELGLNYTSSVAGAVSQLEFVKNEDLNNAGCHYYGLPSRDNKMDSGLRAGSLGFINPSLTLNVAVSYPYSSSYQNPHGKIQQNCKLNLYGDYIGVEGQACNFK